MPEDFPNGQKGICRLPAVSPLMYSTTEAKLPNQTPSKTLVISASAAMPKDLPLWAERNRKIDALRCAPTVKPPAFPNSLRSIRQWWCRDFSLSPLLSESQKTRPFFAPPPHRGHNRLRSQSAMRALSIEYRNIT